MAASWPRNISFVQEARPGVADATRSSALRGLSARRAGGRERKLRWTKPGVKKQIYTRPGSNWRPSACEADVIATRPLVPCMLKGEQRPTAPSHTAGSYREEDRAGTSRFHSAGCCTIIPNPPHAARRAARKKPRARSTKDTLAERLKRRPAKPMGSPRVGSNPTGVVFVARSMRFGVELPPLGASIHHTPSPAHPRTCLQARLPVRHFADDVQ